MLFRFKIKIVIVLSTLIYLYYFLPNLFTLVTNRSRSKSRLAVFPYKLVHTDLDSNCQNFFDQFINDNETLISSNFVFDPTSFEDYAKEKKKSRSKSKSKNRQPPVTDEQIDNWKAEYNRKDKSRDEMTKSLQHQLLVTRVYNQCLIQNKLKIDNSKVSKIEELLFPWSDQAKNSIIRDNFVKDTKNKGIVITASNSHVDVLKSLILILRTLGNDLPIEILHREDLSEDKQNDLQKIATGEINHEEIKKLYQENNGNYENLSNLINREYPPQTITFKGFKAPSFSVKSFRLKKFSNKVFSLAYSSFTEVILMDADTVPFVQPKSFFEIEEYKQTGAFFFRDRELDDKSSGYDLEFWTNLLPIEKENELFGYKTDYERFSNSIRYFNGFTHYLESGVVTINKEKHAGSILVSAQLQLWESATKRVWGDKEFFWLSMLIGGDNDFAVNENPAGAFVQQKEGNDLLNSHKACSVQPVHIHKDKLYWINSGFRVCKKAVSPNEKSRFSPSGLSEKLKFYKSPVKINSVVIPPNIDHYYQTTLLDDNTKVKSWEMMKECAGFMYCASLNVNADGHEYKGKLITFSEQEQMDYNFLGILWTSYARAFVIPEPEPARLPLEDLLLQIPFEEQKDKTSEINEPKSIT